MTWPVWGEVFIYVTLALLVIFIDQIFDGWFVKNFVKTAIYIFNLLYTKIKWEEVVRAAFVTVFQYLAFSFYISLYDQLVTQYELVYLRRMNIFIFIVSMNLLLVLYFMLLKQALTQKKNSYIVKKSQIFPFLLIPGIFFGSVIQIGQLTNISAILFFCVIFLANLGIFYIPGPSEETDNSQETLFEKPAH